MLNQDKYKTPDERNYAFNEWCFNRDCESCKLKAHKFDGVTGCQFNIEAAHQREVGELCGERNGILNANASLADDNDRLRREVAELERKVSELRECLKKAIREKCPFTRMSCKHGEPCDYECGTEKWRNALQDEGGTK